MATNDFTTRPIRVDAEVYAWIQKHAKPFTDTPNTALRRIAGLDIPQPERLRRRATPNQKD